jgi:hypothetical protein
MFRLSSFPFLFFFGCCLTWNLFFFPSVVFYFAIVVGSVLSLSLFFAPCCQGFRRRKKKVFWPKKKLRESVCQ